MPDNASIGVIMLDTQFPRFVGDIGNADSFPFEVVYQIVHQASARAVVSADASHNLEPYINAALTLQNAGVSGITTSCGFLCLAQASIAGHLEVPFVASSLVQLPWIQTLLPAGRQTGILTIDEQALTAAHLSAAGIHHEVPIKGCDREGEFYRAIFDDTKTMNQVQCERENVQTALELIDQYPQLGALVLECTNMTPYARAIHEATTLPVYSIHTLIRWLHSGLSPDVQGFYR